MQKQRNYLVSIIKYELETKAADNIIELLQNSYADLNYFFGSGKLFLPSPMLVEEIRNFFVSKNCHDIELIRLFNKAQLFSQVFYTSLANLVYQSEDDNNEQFVDNFEKQIEPIGKQLINILLCIKYRLKIVKSTAMIIHKNSNKFLNFLSSCVTKIIAFVDNIFYQSALIITKDHQKIIKVYNFLIASFAILTMTNIYWIITLPTTINILIFAMVNLLLLVISFFTYPIRNFGQRDISGQNIIAFKYKLLIKTKQNHKMVDIFSMQHSAF